MRRNISYLALIAIVLGTLPFAIIGQTRTDEWANVTALPQNTGLIVIRKREGKVSGGLDSATDDQIVLSTKSGLITVRKDSVKKIYSAVPRSEQREKNRGAGLGLLAGVGAAFLREVISPSEGQDISSVGFLALGGGLGILYGKQRATGFRKGATIYSAS